MKYKLQMATILLIGVALRVFGLTIHSLWFDELCTVDISSVNSIRDIIVQFRTSEGGSERYQSLNIILLWGFRQMVPTTDHMIRLFPSLISIVSLPLMYRLAAKCLGIAGALCSLAFYACSSYGVYYAQEVRPYALLIFLVMLLLYCLVHAWERNSWGAYLWLGLSCALALWASIFSSLFIVVLSVADFIVHRYEWKRVIVRWIPTVVLCASVIAGYMMYRDVASGTVGAKIPDLAQPVWMNAAFSVYGVMLGTTYGPSIEALRSNPWMSLQQHVISMAGALILAVGLAIALIMTGRRTIPSVRSQHRPLAVFQMAAGLMVVAMVVFSSLANFNWQPRHTFWLLPVMAVAIGAIFSSGGYRRWLAVGSIVMNIYSLYGYWFNMEHRKDDIRGAALYLRQLSEPVLNLSSPHLLRMYEYYGAGNVHQLQGRPALLANELESLKMAQASLVIYRPFYSYWKSRRTLERALGANWEISDEHTFKNITIYHINRKMVAG